MRLAQIEGLVGGYRGEGDLLDFAYKLLSENPDAAAEVRKKLKKDFREWTPGPIGWDRGGRRTILQPNGGNHYFLRGEDGQQHVIDELWGLAAYISALVKE